jgi:ketosteroid isomerase-like protein
VDIDDQVAFLDEAYRLFNAHDVDALLAKLTDDVQWPDVARGKVLRGKVAIRAYWEAQFAAGDPRVSPTAYIPTGDEMVAVVDQRIFDLDGKALGPTAVVYHRYTFAGYLVQRMQVYDDRNAAVIPR